MHFTILIRNSTSLTQSPCSHTYKNIHFLTITFILLLQSCYTWHNPYTSTILLRNSTSLHTIIIFSYIKKIFTILQLPSPFFYNLATLDTIRLHNLTQKLPLSHNHHFLILKKKYSLFLSYNRIHPSFTIFLHFIILFRHYFPSHNHLLYDISCFLQSYSISLHNPCYLTTLETIPTVHNLTSKNYTYIFLTHNHHLTHYIIHYTLFIFHNPSKSTQSFHNLTCLAPSQS